MRDQTVRAVRISLAILTAASYMALGTTEAFGVEVSLVPLVLILGMPFFERLDARYPVYRRITNVITVMFTILLLPFFFRDLITALTTLIVFIQTYLFFHRKGVRDYRYLFLMAFFLLVDAVAQSPDPAFGLIMPLFIVSAVWAFASVQIYAETVANADGNIADLLPEEPRRGFLPPEVAQWISGGRQESMNVAPVLATLSIACVFATSLIFLLTPRMEAGIFGRSNVVATVTPEVSDRVNLSQGGTIGAGERPALLARFPREAQGFPATGIEDLYWRVTSFNRLVGSEWEREPIELDPFLLDVRGQRPNDLLVRPPRGDGRLIEQEIFVEDCKGTIGLPVLTNVVRVNVPSPAGVTWDSTDPMTVSLPRSNSQSLQYRATSEMRQDVDPAFLVDRPGNYAEVFADRSRALRFYTEVRLSQRSRDLARNWTDGMESPYEIARAIEQRLREEYLYSTTLDSLPESSPIDAFLFETRIGHCELFASSMCMLVRSLGIPARVVSGYKGGEWSEPDQAVIVRDKNAHLWVEVYLIGVGWHLFDPSGIAQLDMSWPAVISRALSRYALNAKIAYYRDIIGFSGGVRFNDLARLSIGLFRFDWEVVRRSVPSLQFFSAGLPRILLITMMTIAVLWGLYAMYRSMTLRRKKGANVSYTADQVRATQVYSRLRHRLRAMGANGHAPSARELLREVEQNPALDADAIARIVRLYNDARFGGRELTKQRYASMLRDVKALRPLRPQK